MVNNGSRLVNPHSHTSSTKSALLDPLVVFLLSGTEREMCRCLERLTIRSEKLDLSVKLSDSSRALPSL